MPRIIAGLRRGLSLDVSSGLHTRPTSDRAKEALFSMLAPKLPDASILDLYAGSGQIGLEALSRGAKRAVFVEFDRTALRIIRRNVEKSRLDGAEVIAGNAAKTLANLVLRGETFDLIYFDPPWDHFAKELKAAEPFLSKLLNSDGLLITERQTDPKMPDTTVFVTGLEHIRHCRYGRAMLSFFAVKGE